MMVNECVCEMWTRRIPFSMAEGEEGQKDMDDSCRWFGTRWQPPARAVSSGFRCLGSSCRSCITWARQSRGAALSGTPNQLDIPAWAVSFCPALRKVWLYLLHTSCIEWMLEETRGFWVRDRERQDSRLKS